MGNSDRSPGVEDEERSESPVAQDLDRRRKVCTWLGEEGDALFGLGILDSSPPASLTINLTTDTPGPPGEQRLHRRANVENGSKDLTDRTGRMDLMERRDPRSPFCSRVSSEAPPSPATALRPEVTSMAHLPVRFTLDPREQVAYAAAIGAITTTRTPLSPNSAPGTNMPPSSPVALRDRGAAPLSTAHRDRSAAPLAISMSSALLIPSAAPLRERGAAPVGHAAVGGASSSHVAPRERGAAPVGHGAAGMGKMAGPSPSSSARAPPHKPPDSFLTVRETQWGIIGDFLASQKTPATGPPAPGKLRRSTRPKPPDVAKPEAGAATSQDALEALVPEDGEPSRATPSVGPSGIGLQQTRREAKVVARRCPASPLRREMSLLLGEAGEGSGAKTDDDSS